MEFGNPRSFNIDEYVSWGCQIESWKDSSLRGDRAVIAYVSVYDSVLALKYWCSKDFEVFALYSMWSHHIAVQTYRACKWRVSLCWAMFRYQHTLLLWQIDIKQFTHFFSTYFIISCYVEPLTKSVNSEEALSDIYLTFMLWCSQRHVKTQPESQGLVYSWLKWFDVSLGGDEGMCRTSCKRLLIWAWKLGNWPLQRNACRVKIQNYSQITLLHHRLHCTTVLCVRWSHLEQIRRSKVWFVALHIPWRPVLG